jgi:hypothetical protein
LRDTSGGQGRGTNFLPTVAFLPIKCEAQDHAFKAAIQTSSQTCAFGSQVAFLGPA